MATVESFRALLKPLIVFSKIIGVEMWTAPGKFLPASCYLSVQMAIYLISTVFTAVKYRADLLHLMKVLVTLGTALQLYVKFFVALTKGIDVMLLTETIEREILERYQNGTKEEVAVLDRTGRYLWIIYRTMRLVCNVTAVIFLLYPLFAYWTIGIAVPFLLHELPYLDFTTTTGYVLNLLFQLNLIVNGVMGVILSDFLYIMFGMYAMAAADIFILHLVELESMLNDPMQDNTNRPEVRGIWAQCLYDHQLATSIFNNAEDVLGLQCLAQVTLGVFTLCDCMLLVALTDWYPTYCFFLVMFTELSIYFLVGNIIELKIDEMYNKIISMPWYKLPAKAQKEFCFLMARQQRPMMFTAYGFHPMNFEAYMSVLRGLYQFFVMVLQYVG
ncbi:putative odorant receptor 83c [Anopheles maculipalpis]|uniref:putative odorant receptor 83c n=1 Tax=Anopheles maculipalpis TaxID=1496333 RepID=UPI002158D7B7|nr:putative odorant receptor 83c [Anopheles maculipalpis]